MPQSIIILKNSGDSGKEPLAADLDYGEVAINYADGRLFYKDSNTVIQSFTSDPGTVKSVDISGGNTGLTATGGPITDIGTITIGGTLNISSGGTGANTATDAINALLPVQANNVGKLLSTNGNTISWVIVQYNDIAGIPNLANVAISGQLGDLVNVNFAVQPINNQVLTYSAITGQWVSANTQLPQYLNQIGDVYAPFPIAEGTVLVYDSSNSRWQSTTLLDQQTMDGGTY